MLQPGTLIHQRYQIVGQVGKGGTGEVYEAIDTRLRHRVALKQMLITDPAYARVFEHEAILLADLDHARLPKVTDHFSDPPNGQFLVMEFIPGADLATLLQQQGGPFPVAQVLVWADQLLDLLIYLHNRTPPVLHRDIKPGNLKVAQDGTLRLLDFGLAKGVLTQTHLTSDRSVFGYTEAYAPLEQIQGTGTEARSDLYAVGATLYHLLVGAPPPDALTRAAQLLNQQPDPLRPPHERTPAMPQAVSAALVQALSIQITARPANATVLRDALRAALPSSAGTSAPLDPTLVAPFQTVAARQGGQQPPAVGTRTLVVPSQPKPKPRKSPVLWLGALVVVLVGVFLWVANRGTAHPPTSAPVVVPPTFTRTTEPPTVAPAVVPPTNQPAWVPEMVAVPAGSFLMGSNSADSQADGDEYPQHTLILPAYEIGKTEVTNAQFRPFVEGDGYTNQAYWTKAGWAWRQAEKITQPGCWDDAAFNGDAQPVACVSWFEAVAYTRWLSVKTGLNFSLPTEAEWEYAARGSKGLIYPWGNTWDAKRVNSSESGLYKTMPVGSYPSGASPFGAMDMAGNVWEWCATQGGKPYPYQLEDEWQTAYLEATAEYRVLRGGSSWNKSTSVRGAYRNYNLPRDRYDDKGLRVASHSLMP